MNFLSRLNVYCATLGPIGFYFPASGAWGTAAAIPFMLALRKLGQGHWWYSESIILLILLVATWFIIDHAREYFPEHDAPEIVIDEMVAFCLVLYQIPWTVPFISVAFLLFRIFDSTKIFGIRDFEDIPGAWGILLDDIIAAFYTYFTIYVALRLWFMFVRY